MGLRGPGASKLKAAQKVKKPRARRPSWERKGLTRAARVIAFLQSLPITSGIMAGKKMKLLPWQREVIEDIYKTDGDGKRIVRTALITLPRGNGKTGLAAGLCLAHMVGPESEQRGQCYSAAADRNQAALIFNELEAIILQTPWMAARVNIQRFHKRIEDSVTGSIYQALSADARKAHGLNVSFYVYDELAQAANRHLLDGLQTGTGKRAEPLGIVISTQSDDPLHVMSELVDYGRQVQQGVLIDPAFHATIYAAPDDADPWAESTWRACNPSLGHFRDLKELQQYAERAQRIPALEPVFRRLYLNQRTDQDERFINSTEWDACNGQPDVGAFKGRPCFGGLDLGSVRDLTALVLVFPDDNGGFDVVPFFWCPKDNIREREDADRVPYMQWQTQGFIEATPGACIDFSFVAHKLGELSGQYDIQAVAFDRWRIKELQLELSKEGVTVPLEPFGQGFQSMSPALEHLERTIIDRKLRHGGNPILRWNASNAVVVRDPAGNAKLDKERSRERIDGLVALVMALGVAKKHEPAALPACLIG